MVKLSKARDRYVLMMVCHHVIGMAGEHIEEFAKRFSFGVVRFDDHPVKIKD